MSASFVRNVLPVVTAVVSTLFLATAVPRDLPEQSASTWLASAEVQRCVADGRDADACLDGRPASHRLGRQRGRRGERRRADRGRRRWGQGRGRGRGR